MNGNSDTAKALFPILLSEMGNLTREVKALIDKDDAESGVRICNNATQHTTVQDSLLYERSYQFY